MENLEVLNVGIFGVHVELDAGHGYIEEDAVVDLAKGGTVSGNERVSLGRSFIEASSSVDSESGGGVSRLTRYHTAQPL